MKSNFENSGFSSYEHLTKMPEEAKQIWESVCCEIKRNNREDLLMSPNVLDIGGGIGVFSKYLKEIGISCINLDIQPLNFKHGANSLMADVQKMPFKNETFDLIYSYGLFDQGLYKKNLSDMIEEVHRILKTEGLLITRGGLSFCPPKEVCETYFKILPSKNIYTPCLYEKKV